MKLSAGSGPSRTERDRRRACAASGLPLFHALPHSLPQHAVSRSRTDSRLGEAACAPVAAFKCIATSPTAHTRETRRRDSRRRPRPPTLTSGWAPSSPPRQRRPLQPRQRRDGEDRVHPATTRRRRRAWSRLILVGGGGAEPDAANITTTTSTTIISRADNESEEAARRAWAVGSGQETTRAERRASRAERRASTRPACARPFHSARFSQQNESDSWHGFIT